MNVSSPSSPNPAAVPDAGNAPLSSSSEPSRADVQPAAVSGGLLPPSKATKTPTLTRLKTQFSRHNLRGGEKSASEPLSGEAVSGSLTSPFSFLSSPFGGAPKRAPAVECTDDVIADARAMRVKLGGGAKFDQWMSERLEKGSKTEVAKELHDSAQAVIDKQLAEEKSGETRKRFKEWIKDEKKSGATVFETSYKVENAQNLVSKLREAGVKKAVEQGAREKDARKNFDLQIMKGRTIIEAELYLNMRAFDGDNDSAAPRGLSTEQKEQITEMRAQKKNRPMDQYDRELAALESDSSSAENGGDEAEPSSVMARAGEVPPDSEKSPPSPAERRKNRDDQIAAAREALGSLAGAFVAAGEMNLPGN
jgi:hypothetical protein